MSMEPLRVLFVSSILLSVVFVGDAYRGPDKRALYFLDNDPSGASIVSLKISNDGKLSSPSRSPTGGKGLFAVGPELPVAGAPNVAETADTLFSQNAVVVDGNYLFTVNAGSNTLSMFLINKNYPTSLTLVGTPADTLGEFPVSVAYSSKLKTACVLNGGKLNGVTCFSVDSVSGLTVLDKSPRPLPQLNQTTPPIGITDTASDIVFNPSSTALFVAIKGNNFTYRPIKFANTYSWPVVDGKVSFKPSAISTLETVLSPYSIQFAGEDESKLYVSDLFVGGAIFDVSPSPEFKITVRKVLNIPYNLATCWTSYSPITKAIYFTDVLQPNITLLDIKSEKLSGVIDFPSTAPPGTDFAIQMNNAYGGYDSVTDRTYLYVLSGTQNIIVIDILTKTTVQNIDLSALGSRQGWKGMAVYSKL